jgi:DNA invertase Pin-like site-specific DNA recombinase
MADEMKTYLYCQSDGLLAELSAAKQEVSLRKQAKARNLPDPIPVVEPSARKTNFSKRDMGGWLLRNVKPGDVVMFYDLRRCGAANADIVSVMKTFHKKKVDVVIDNFLNRKPITLTCKIFPFFLFVLEALVEGLQDVRGALLTEAVIKKKRAGEAIGVQWGQHKNPIPGKTASHGRQAYKVDWDSQQLRYIADIANRWLLKNEKIMDIVLDFHAQGLLDHTGRLWGERSVGLRNENSNTCAAYREAVGWFLKAGLAGELPPKWISVAKTIWGKMRELGIPMPQERKPR